MPGRPCPRASGVRRRSVAGPIGVGASTRTDPGAPGAVAGSADRVEPGVPNVRVRPTAARTPAPTRRESGRDTGTRRRLGGLDAVGLMAE